MDNSTLSAASDPIVASTLANPPHITKVEVTRDVKLMVFLSAAWNGGSGMTSISLHWRNACDQ